MKTEASTSRHRAFSMSDQEDFAALSGDRNALHLNELAARRLLFGAPVVHAIHLILWAVDDHLRDHVDPVQISELRAAFPRPVLVDEEVTCRTRQEGELIVCEIRDQHESVAVLKVSFRDGSSQYLPQLNPLPPGTCKSLNFEDAKHAVGRMSLAIDATRLEKMLPAVSRVLPRFQVAELLAATKLVGMECPGEHSVFSKLDLKFGDTMGEEPTLEYKVSLAQERLSFIQLSIKGPGLTGRLQTFLRPSPVKQPSLQTVAKLVRPMEFEECQALVVGGSRGLGEVTAKLICAGGGSVRLTYHRGKDEAARIVDEVVQANHDAAALAVDVLHDWSAIDQLLEEGWKPTHLFYYATPFIFGKSEGLFSPAKMQMFLSYYIGPLLEIITLLRARSATPLNVLYPSTVAVEELPRDLGEYAVAKAASETVCRYLDAHLPDVSIHTPRLGRTRTDQTGTMVPVETMEAEETVLAILRQMASTQRPLQP